MQLSNRLKEVANFVTRGNRVADIGTDHGYVPIYLIRQNIATKVIAMDVKKGPLKRAKNHIIEANLEDRIETRLSDGLAALKENEVDTVVIAGMGGPLMMRILSEGSKVLDTVSELILSPQSDIGNFREFLQLNNYEIIRETMVKEDGKYYNIIKAKKGTMNYDKYIYFKYGKLLLEERNPILQEFIEKELQKYQIIRQRLQLQLNEKYDIQIEKRLDEVSKEINYLNDSRDYNKD